MNKVLNITSRLEDKKRKHQIEIYRDKIETVQRFVQCSSCHFKCAMCGHHFENTESIYPPSSSPSPGFYLCESCRAEFEDFLKITSGKKGSDVFWHNKEWVKLWSSWLDFRQAIGDFKNSAEFEQITKNFDKCD